MAQRRVVECDAVAAQDRPRVARAQSTAGLARVIRFLGSEESAYITGQNLRVGGETRSV